MVRSETYDPAVNTYGVRCGSSLDVWEGRGWINQLDPYGWFQWYCRFWQGRRTPDDERQIDRWRKCTGALGRWRVALVKAVDAGASDAAAAGGRLDDPTIRPAVRQILQHWAYVLTQEGLEETRAAMEERRRTPSRRRRRRA